MTDLGDDYYELDKDNYRVIGQHTKKIYAFGDGVKVKVKETNLARRSMDLYLAGTTPGRRSEFSRQGASRDNDRRSRDRKPKEPRGSGRVKRSSGGGSGDSSPKPKRRRR
jgi:ribonuclease R